MTTPSDRFPVPDGIGDSSVWADRVAERSLLGRNQRGVEIPIGKGEGQISPGELLKLALIGCAGMSSDHSIGRRMGQDFDMRLWAHGAVDEAENRYPTISEEVQLDVEGLSTDDLEQLRTVITRAIEAGCTVERTVTQGVTVEHAIPGPDASEEQHRR